MSPLRLGVNIDHAATVRQARFRGEHQSPHAEPDLLEMAREATAGGADGITVHLREDRRHLQDSDLAALMTLSGIRLNLEMACTAEMQAIALQYLPPAICIVPENRHEVTTEGGLDVAGQMQRVTQTVTALKQAGLEVSLFIGPDLAQIQAAAAAGAPVIELHTGAWAHAYGLQPEIEARELARLQHAADVAHGLGLVVNAGHGINYANVAAIRTLPWLNELNIGHSIVARALTVGMRSAVREMRSELRL